MSFPPNSDVVCTFWLKTLSALSTLVGTQVATTLPAQGTLTHPVFLQVTTVTHRVDRYDPSRQPVVTVDAWAAPGLLGEVATALEIVRDATYLGSGLGTFTTKTGFTPVRLADVSVFSGPRPVRNDPAALAHQVMDLELTYVILEVV